MPVDVDGSELQKMLRGESGVAALGIARALVRLQQESNELQLKLDSALTQLSMRDGQLEVAQHDLGKANEAVQTAAAQLQTAGTLNAGLKEGLQAFYDRIGQLLSPNAPEATATDTEPTQTNQAST